ncbi:MAG: DUF3299 domain-containing protein [Microscillaceae bacterium]|jgi:hypothetical protein|nr:DUF3299 domain-containing protein [Microscillaceae bacterium]
MNKWIILTALILLAVLLYRVLNVNPAYSRKSNPPIAKQDTLYDLADNETDSLNFLVEVPIKSALWDTLMDITYQQKSEYGYKPQFKAKHQRLNAQKIEIQGYMYPLEEGDKQTFFMLSRNPVSSCFFCGGAGPETVIEVNSPKGIKMSQKPIKLRGRLKLNTSEPERLFFILNEAEVL